MDTQIDVVIVGGGAAGFFAAIRCADLNPIARIIILEKGREVLQKVKISGGGRCNVTHACWDPAELVNHYPRGKKELLGPFHRFACGDTMEWFENRGVDLKIESDGRVFPQSNSSQSIIDCFHREIQKNNIQVTKQMDVVDVQPPSNEEALWQVTTRNGTVFQSQIVMMATGSNPRVWKLLNNLGHQIIEPVPSLFTFNIQDKRLHGIPGISMPNAEIHASNSKLQSHGPLLITHWGLSGPAVLKLSAWGARRLAQSKYDFDLRVNWLGRAQEVESELLDIKKEMPKKQVTSKAMFGVPNRLWQRIIGAAGIFKENWGDLNKRQINRLGQELTAATFKVKGKSTFKEEFVTAGGLDLKEVNFKHFNSKLIPGLFFAGEVLNIDAITGGFNFQAAWTGSWIAGEAMADYLQRA